jgi:hypothetical protein
VKVKVWHLEPCEQQADFRRPIGELDCPADRVASRHQVVAERHIGVEPVIDLLPRHDQRVARTERLDRQEGDGALILPHETSRKRTFDDPREERRHAFFSFVLLTTSAITPMMARTVKLRDARSISTADERESGKRANMVVKRPAVEERTTHAGPPVPMLL